MALVQTNQVFPATQLTGTGTSPAIDLSPNQAGANGAFKRGIITLTGSSITTVTFGLLGSADGGKNFFPILIVPVNSGTPASTVTATSAGIYRVNLSALTHIQYIVSGTFTATGAALTLTGSPNASDL